ncbi:MULTISPECIES: Uma2 family endonuclease [unclassified Nodularia (in: cyanobacteria)]|uniref:Uma2 family endonuclease n=1 Tax=unclassified Nodularia (in: cyanobacteria) TaxID=2656917 RepID=UPI00187FC12A|nr:MULTISPECIES: Uma2 family endonuclease [unclassified Nodularia (in: cyanobacteria)]MBE9199736.1 Uma2 family endonuclease [Nodularia sp. LEGE 06071]MCC2693362.1 Uma2 family endonuclease [Nodularia sp. LEGE 04288]
MVALPDNFLMSAAEYLLWEPTQEQRYEYWDGEVVAMSGGTRNHNRVSLNFSKLLDDALADRSCEVYIVDVKVQVEPGQKYFYPDVVVTCDQRDRDPQLIQFPCLIIEVLSPSTEAADRGKKFAKYRQSPTLQEYVLVQVAQPLVEVFRRNQQGQWVLSEYNLGDRLRLESVDVEIAIADLYRQVQFEPETTDEDV